MLYAKAVLKRDVHNQVSSAQPPVWAEHNFSWQIIRVSNAVSPRGRPCLLVELDRSVSQVKYLRKYSNGGFHFAVVYAGQYGSEIKRQTMDRRAAEWADFLHWYVWPAAKEYLKATVHKKHFDGIRTNWSKKEVLAREKLMREEFMRVWGLEWENNAALNLSQVAS